MNKPNKNILPQHPASELKIIAAFNAIPLKSGLQLICSTFYTNTFLKDQESLNKFLKIADLFPTMLRIVSVYKGYRETTVETLYTVSGRKIEWTHISFYNLFRHLLFTEVLKKDTIHLKNTFFIFEGLYWLDVLLGFKQHRVSISGGSNTLRHVLSPVQFRLSQFIMCLEGGIVHKAVGDSFHLSNKTYVKPGVKFNDICYRSWWENYCKEYFEQMKSIESSVNTPSNSSHWD